MEERIENESELLAWIEGNATPDQEARASAQLASDPQLSRLAHELRADRALLQQLGEADPPAGLLADAQTRLERSLLLDCPDGDDASVLAAPLSTGSRRGRRLGAWGSLAAVFLLAVTLGVTWKLGVFRTGPTSLPTGQGGSSFALEKTEDDVYSGIDAPIAAGDDSQRRREHTVQPDDRLTRGLSETADEVAEGVVAGRDQPVAAVVAKEKGADDDEELLAHADRAAPTEEPPVASGGIPDGHTSLGAPVVADAEAESLEPAEERPPETVLVWSGEVPMEVEPALLEDRGFQQNLVLQVSHDRQEFLRRNAVQMRVGVLQQQMAPAGPPRSDSSVGDESLRAGAAVEPAEESRGRQLADEIKGVLNDEMALSLPVAEPQMARELGEGGSDYGRIMMQSPGGRLYELEVPMRQLPEYVSALNTPTQSAWLEYDATRRLHYQEARRRLLSGHSIFWWRQEAWEPSRRQTIYRLDPLPSEAIDDAAPASAPADSVDEPSEAAGETPK